MSFEEGDSVVLHDEHSEFDGETGRVEIVMETMFGDENYTVSFEDGQEAGIPADSLEAADGEGDEDDEGDEETADAETGGPDESGE